MRTCYALALACPAIASADLNASLLAASGSSYLVKIVSVLAAGADPNTRDDAGNTPLPAAAGEGHAKAISVLLAAGADPNASAQGVTPLQIAAEAGHTDAVDALAAADSLPSTTSGSRNGDAADWPRRRFRIFRSYQSRAIESAPESSNPEMTAGLKLSTAR